MRDRLCSPYPAVRLQRGSGRPNSDFAVAMRMSHWSDSSNPPATQKPSMAAMIGLNTSRSMKEPPLLVGERRSPLASSEARSLRSIPAEKARPPSPVMMATSASLSSRKSSSASRSPALNSRLRAFSTSGRLSVM